jgi:alpha-ribazole phosphatase/probable phosphoglycerate mutase
MRLLLVRHAEPADDARGRCYGTLDVDLSAAGRAQCATLSDRLAAEPLVAVVSSPRRRALETAAAIATPHGLAVEAIDDLRELDFGELEGRTYDEIAATRPELYAQWMETPTRVRFPGGEGFEDLQSRVEGTVETLRERHAGGTVVAVTHGGPVRAVVAGALGMPPERIFRLAVDTASVTEVEWLDGAAVVRSLNAT